MKTIEEKAKRYDEALEKSKRLYEQGTITESLCYVFPELKESEDERIRKYLIKCVNENMFVKPFNADGFDKQTILAWLEKHGEPKVSYTTIVETGDGGINALVTRELPTDGCDDEQKPVIEMKSAEESLGIDSDTYNKIVDECIFGEQKPAWSEEDEKNLSDAILFIKTGTYSLDKEMLINWLKDLKDRVQPQPRQEWSQNDIDMIDWLIRCCEKEHEELCNDKYGHQDIVSDLKRDCRKKWNWLESLKNKVVPQNTWKPSDEQMKVLQWCMPLWSEFKSKAILESFINDLKKLREE